MAKKLKGDFFFLTANDLQTGAVLFYTKKGWLEKSINAIKIPRKKIEHYEEIAKKYENNCKIVSPFFVELDESGNIKSLRDKIRDKGITIKLENV